VVQEGRRARLETSVSLGACGGPLGLVSRRPVWWCWWAAARVPARRSPSRIAFGARFAAACGRPWLRASVGPVAARFNGEGSAHAAACAAAFPGAVGCGPVGRLVGGRRSPLVRVAAVGGGLWPGQRRRRGPQSTAGPPRPGRAV